MYYVNLYLCCISKHELGLLFVYGRIPKAVLLECTFMKLLFLTALICACGFASAEAVYKCTDNGKVSYSNEPCLGAQRVDTMATRGLDKMSGVQRSGNAVQAEKNNEAIERAMQSVVGKNYRRDRAIKRQYHSAFDKLQCERLDGQIEALEKEESYIKNKVQLEVLQAELFQRRKAFKDLDC